jgi:hypothetical protein
MIMKNNPIYLSIIWIIILIIHGCDKGPDMEFTDWPIVEAYLIPGSPFLVRVSRQVPFSEDVEYSSDNIDSLTIEINYNDTLYSPEPISDGYYCDSSLTVIEGATYNLTFRFNLKDVRAYTYVPAKPVNFEQSENSIEIERMDSTLTPPSGGFSMPDPVSLTWDNDDLSYYLVVVENIEDTLDPIRDFGDEDPPENIFRKSPNTSTSEELRPNDFQYYGTHRIVLFHVLADYAALYESISNSSQDLTNPSTSIENGYGIFTGMNSDTLFLEVTEAK